MKRFILLIAIMGTVSLLYVHSLENPVSLQSYNFPETFIGFLPEDGFIAVIDDAFLSGTNAFYIVPGLSDENLISMKSNRNPDFFIVEEGGNIKLKKLEGIAYASAGTFKRSGGLADQNDPSLISFESQQNPSFFIRHRNSKLYMEYNDGSELFKKDATFRIASPRTASDKKTAAVNKPMDAITAIPNISFVLFCIIIGIALVMVIIDRKKRSR